MSGKLKEVRERISSVKSTQQITKAMKMVSAAKLRRSQDAITTMRPYSNKLSDILNNILISEEGGLSIDLSQSRELKNVLIVLYTSNRGLCGAFNSNLIKKAKELIRNEYSRINPANIHILTIGRKGMQQFVKLDYTVEKRFANLLDEVSFEDTAEAAQFVIDGFRAGKWDKVDLVYSQFRNAATQVIDSEPFLPLLKQDAPEAVAPTQAVDFIFEPNKGEIVKVLIPKILKTQFYKALLDTSASEHGARMTAMDKATENAEDLMRDLRISYNRARQAAITTEITEIVSGAAALEQG